MTVLRGALIALLAALSGDLAQAAASGDAHTLAQVHFSVSAETQVANDRVVAVLYAEHQGETLAPLTQALNKTVARALSEARATRGVRARTLDYRTNPVYRDRKLIGWRVRQALRLESADVDSLSTLIGSLQQQLAVQSINYVLSPGAREVAEEGLVADALAAFRRRAEQVAKALGGRYRIVRIDLGNGTPPPRPYPLRSATVMSAAASAPALQPGNQPVRLTATGSIELLPDD